MQKSEQAEQETKIRENIDRDREKNESERKNQFLD